jgi:LmbE family N-acetylglucosaminyl deacetylase
MDPSSNEPTGLDTFAEVKRAIVVAAHADDMETMMGGTLWLLAQRGVEFYELICTRGDLGTQDSAQSKDALAIVRHQEAQRAAEILGVREVVTLDHHDGELEPSLELRAQIAFYYRKWQVDTIFTFDPSWHGQIHADHRAVGRAAVDAIMPSRMPLYRPEQLAGHATAQMKRVFLFSPGEASVYVDVTDVYHMKVAAGVAHVSQFPEGDKNLDWMRQLDSMAAQAAGQEGRYLERFAALRIW